MTNDSSSGNVFNIQSMFFVYLLVLRKQNLIKLNVDLSFLATQLNITKSHVSYKVTLWSIFIGVKIPLTCKANYRKITKRIKINQFASLLEILILNRE